MKSIKIFSLLALVAAFASCDPNQLEVVKAYEPSNYVAPTLKDMPTVAVSQTNYDAKNTVTFSWDKADFGMDTAVNYAIYMTRPNGTDMCLASAIYSTQYTIDYQSLYAKLVGESNLGLAKGALHTVPVYIVASLGDSRYQCQSAPKNVTFEVSRISTGINMLYVSGDFNNNHPDKHGIEETTPGTKSYQGLVNMKSSVGSNKVKFLEYTYAGTLAGDTYGDKDGMLGIGGDGIAADPELSYVRADLNKGTYSIYKLGGAVKLCGFNGSWSFRSNPELVYNAEENAWIGTAEYKSSNFRISINDSWSYTFGPKTINELTVKDGSDIKIYHNDISKKFVGGDANVKLNAPGNYVFKFYYESADATWHLSIRKAE